MVKRLSDELYTKKIHFIYEILQNADDNDYLPNIIPSIKFILFSDKIIAINNEIGFKKENIDSICFMAKSSKIKNAERHDTGEKGIGFRSVFTISDTPLIISNGYQFMFNNSSQGKSLKSPFP